MTDQFRSHACSMKGLGRRMVRTSSSQPASTPARDSTSVIVRRDTGAGPRAATGPSWVSRSVKTFPHSVRGELGAEHVARDRAEPAFCRVPNEEDARLAHRTKVPVERRPTVLCSDALAQARREEREAVEREAVAGGNEHTVCVRLASIVEPQLQTPVAAIDFADARALAHLHAAVDELSEPRRAARPQQALGQPR